MKKEFTPGHFFMNRSLIWGREGEVEGELAGGKPPHSRVPVSGGGIGAGADASGQPSNRSLRGDHEGSAVPREDPATTDVCEEEEDAGEKGDDLPGQAQVVDGGGVRVGGLRGKDRAERPRHPRAGRDPASPPARRHWPTGLCPGAVGLTGPSMGR